MFGFLKKKLKDAVGKFSKKAEDSSKEDSVEEDIEKQEEETKEEEEKEEDNKKEEESKEEKPKKSVISKLKEKITSTKISENKFDELFWDLELALMENNVAVEIIEKIKIDLKGELVDVALERGDLQKKINNSLRKTIEAVLDCEAPNLIENIRDKKDKPFVIVFFGTNGAGKTTSIAKFTKMLMNRKLKVLLSASDTYRAGAIDQIKEWGSKLDVKVIFHDYKSDPSAVAFDAIQFAKSHDVDVVLIDTAGRQHSNINLMEEMKKIVRVANPDFKIFIGESTTGNDAVTQSQRFDDAVGIDGIVLTKADIDEKGGAMISVSSVTGKPILYLGTGQQLEDLKEFNKEEIMEKIGV